MNPHALFAEAIDSVTPMQLPLPRVATAAATSADTLATPMEYLMAIRRARRSFRLHVLLLGESGVGKERLARWLHDASAVIVVAGATGRLGRLVVDALLQTVRAIEIAVAVRTPAKASDVAGRGCGSRRHAPPIIETLA